METLRAPGNFDFTALNLSELWKTWSQKLKWYIDAAGVDVKADSRKIAILLTCIGDEGIKLYNTFKLEAEGLKFQTVLEKFETHFKRDVNVVFERYKFLSARQKSDQSFDQFLLELKKLIASCAYQQQSESEFLRDAFVIGIRDDVLKEKLLRKEDLTLEETIKIYKLHEASQQQVCEMISHPKQSAEYDVNALSSRGPVRKTTTTRSVNQNLPSTSNSQSSQPVSRRSSNKQQVEQRSCKKCGQVHHHNKCPALGAVCYRCKKLNHYSKMCQSKNVRNVRSINLASNLKFTNSVSEEDFFLGNIEYNQTNVTEKKIWNVKIDVNGHEMVCQLDTGAQANVMSLRAYKNLQLRKSSLKTCNSSVATFTGDKVQVIGKCLINGKLILENNRSKNVEINFIITRVDCPTVIGLQDCIRLNLVQKINNLQVENFQERILKEFSDVFEGLGCIPFECHLTLKSDAQPTIDPLRKVPFKLLSRLQEELERMEKLHVIEKVKQPTEWVNSIVVVEKNNGKLRVCLDPRKLNEALKRSHFPLPDINDIKSKLNGAKYFSVLDASSGFWMCPLDKESSYLCTFNTPFGRYRFLRLPFGLSIAPEFFQRVMADIFSDLEAIVYVDDVLVWGKSREEHDLRLRKVLEKARSVNLKFNKKKCKFGIQEVKYFGHIFSAEGMKPDEEKIRAICEMPSPKNVKELQRFLGIVNYVSPFISNLSQETTLLRSLLRKNITWQWSEAHAKVFNRLKFLISHSPVLAYFDPKKPITLSVDASQFAVGAAIFQLGRPIAFASKTLTSCQCRYAQIEKELYAILFGCQRFHQYLYGQKILVETDHKPLISLFKKPLAEVPTRLQRMMLALQGYHFNVEYKRGSLMYVADALSRAPLPQTEVLDIEKDIQIHVGLLKSCLAVSDTMLEKIEKATSKDEQLQELKFLIENGWPEHKRLLPESVRQFWNMRHELFLIDGMVFKNNSILIPRELRTEILKIVHEGHMGIDKCKKRLRGSVYWIGMASEMTHFVESCQICNKYRNSNQREPLLTHEIPRLPWIKLGADIFELDQKSYILVVDYYSKFIEVAQLSSTNANNVVTAFKQIFARHGICQVLMTDNGPPFNSESFKGFAEIWGFKHITSSPYHAQSNGLAERSIQTIKRMLRKARESGTDPHLCILNYNATPLYSGYSPAQLLMSRQLRTRLPTGQEHLKPSVINYEKHYQSAIAAQRKMRKYYNRNSKLIRDFKIGEYIWFKKNPNSEWVRGRIIKKSAQPRSYIIKDNDGRTYRRNRRMILIRKNKHSYLDLDELSNENLKSQVQGGTDSIHLSSERRNNGSYVTRYGRSIRPPDRFTPK